MKKKSRYHLLFTRSFQSSIKRMFRPISTFNLVNQVLKVLKLRELSLSYSVRKYQRLLRTSDLYAQVTKVLIIIIRVTGSIELSMDSWPRVVISQTKMELVVIVYTVKSSKMNKFGIHILMEVCYQWLILDLTLMGHSFSFASRTPHI